MRFVFLQSTVKRVFVSSTRDALILIPASRYNFANSGSHRDAFYTLRPLHDSIEF